MSQLQPQLYKIASATDDGTVTLEYMPAQKQPIYSTNDKTNSTITKFNNYTVIDGHGLSELVGKYIDINENVVGGGGRRRRSKSRRHRKASSSKSRRLSRRK